VQHLGDRRLDAFMRIGDHQLGAAQAAAGELAQERAPERLASGPSTGTVNYSIRTPFWLTARPTFGRGWHNRHHNHAQYQLHSISSSAGCLWTSIAFTNVTNGQGTRLVIRGGYLLDSRGDHLQTQEAAAMPKSEREVAKTYPVRPSVLGFGWISWAEPCTFLAVLIARSSYDA
jgi:hypothetical protein